jgi:hypothetical protein
VHLEKCLFPLSLPFLCVAYSCAVVDKKDHTTGAIQIIKKNSSYKGEYPSGYGITGWGGVYHVLKLSKNRDFGSHLTGFPR